MAQYNIYYENKINNILEGFKLYNTDGYENLISKIIPDLKTGNILGNQVDINNSTNLHYYETTIPTTTLFSKVYGNVTLKYSIDQNNNIYIESIDSNGLFDNAINEELVEYKGIIVAKENLEVYKEKIDEAINEINNKTNKKKNKNNNSKKEMNMPKSLKTANENTFEEGTLAADIYEIYNSMDEITSNINKYNNEIVKNTNTSFESSTKIPSSLYNIQSEILNASSTLIGKLNDEASIISNIADTIYTMDQDLANKANNLVGSNILNTSSIVSKLDNTISSYYDTNITFTTGILSSLNAKGNTGKICISDIDKILSGKSLTGQLEENFNLEINNSKEIIEKLSTFTSVLSNNKFKGKIWDKVKQKITNYSELMNERIKSNKKLRDAYIEALTLIKNYLGEDEVLDDSMLPELKSQLENLKNLIDETNAKINSKSLREKTDKNHNTYTYYDYTYSESERNNYRQLVNNYESQVFIINNQIEKLEYLPVIINQAEKIINDALIEIQYGYGNKVSELTTGKKSTYIPIKTDNIIEKQNNNTNDITVYHLDSENTILTDKNDVIIKKNETKTIEKDTNTSPTFAYNGNIIINKNKNYSQIDWNKDVYEYTKSNGYPVWSNFGENGCGTCTAAEVISNLCNKEITPCDIINKEYELSGHKKSKTADGAQLFETIAGEYGCSSEKITTSDVTERYVQNVLQNGGQIAHTKTMKETGQTHYIAIVGYNTNNNKYIIFDPWTRFNNSVYREYTFDEYVQYRNGGIGNQGHVIYKNN